jgi:hypothetical protein
LWILLKLVNKEWGERNIPLPFFDINTEVFNMCTIRIKRTNSGNFDPSITRGELNYDYFTNTLFVGSGDGTAIPMARKVDGATGANLFLPENDDFVATQESAKEYIDSIIGPYVTEPIIPQLLGITELPQTVIYSTTTDTVLEWDTSLIYEESENNLVQVVDEELYPTYEAFFQTEEDIMYVKVHYSLLLSDVGSPPFGTPGAWGDTYTNSMRFCAIKLIRKQDINNENTRYFGAQKVAPLSSSSALSAVRLPSMVSGVGIVPLPRRTADDSWNFK